LIAAAVLLGGTAVQAVESTTMPIALQKVEFSNACCCCCCVNGLCSLLVHGRHDEIDAIPHGFVSCRVSTVCLVLCGVLAQLQPSQFRGGVFSVCESVSVVVTQCNQVRQYVATVAKRIARDLTRATLFRLTHVSQRYALFLAPSLLSKILTSGLSVG
jgi:hypothetical protein